MHWIPMRLNNAFPMNLKFYNNILGILSILLLMTAPLVGQARQVINFNAGWWFKLDSSQHHANGRNGDGWRSLDLPHDRSIDMPFKEHSPAGSGAAYLDGPVGWYEKSFVLAETDRTQRIFIAFEGV